MSSSYTHCYRHYLAHCAATYLFPLCLVSTPTACAYPFSMEVWLKIGYVIPLQHFCLRRAGDAAWRPQLPVIRHIQVKLLQFSTPARQPKQPFLQTQLVKGSVQGPPCGCVLHTLQLRSACQCSFGVVLLEIVTGVMPVTRGQTAQPIVPDDCPEVRHLPPAQAYVSPQLPLQTRHYMSLHVVHSSSSSSSSKPRPTFLSGRLVLPL